MREIGLTDAVSPLVMAIDIGSSSVRALLYDAHGNQISATEHQEPHSLRTTPDGGATADPDHLVELAFACLDHALANAAARRGDIAAVAMSSFWHSLLGLAAGMTPTTAVLMWADKRSGNDAMALAAALDGERIHAETGCRLHSSYWPAKLRWLQRTAPDVFAATRTWVSLPDYVSYKIHDELSTSISMASGTGIMRVSGAAWHQPMLDALGIPFDALPKLTDRDVAFPKPRPELCARWPELAGVPWYPAIGDGAAANVGAGCVGSDRIALTIGTSGAMRAISQDDHDYEDPVKPLSPKLWRYRLDRSHRVAGGALSNGGNITAWLANVGSGASFDDLTAEAKTVAPDGHGLTVLPFFAGERSPSWNDRATGTITGLHLGTTRGELFRAFLEATAYRFASIYEDLRHLVAPEHEIHANGAAALGSPLWLQIIADTLRHSIDALDAEAEASARGAAICALESINAIDTLLSAPHSVVHTYAPDPTRGDIYARGRARLEWLETTLDQARAGSP
ncbi:MAG TPA: gluconokinase [Thermomicrobiales bacterium]|nr:gluconokinase [Thermomicrobiales bacterium]